MPGFFPVVNPAEHTRADKQRGQRHNKAAEGDTPDKVASRCSAVAGHGPERPADITEIGSSAYLRSPG